MVGRHSIARVRYNESVGTGRKCKGAAVGVDSMDGVLVIPGEKKSHIFCPCGYVIATETQPQGACPDCGRAWADNDLRQYMPVGD